MITLFVVPVVFCGYKEFKMHAGLADRYWAGTEQQPEPVTVSQNESLLPV